MGYDAASVYAYDVSSLMVGSESSQPLPFLTESSIGLNPSWIIATAPNMQGHQSTSLFAVSESFNYENTSEGTVSSIELDCDGKARATSRQKSGDGSPVYLSLDRSGDHVLVANYGAINAAKGTVGDG